jgi:hypothetical protein
MRYGRFAPLVAGLVLVIAGPAYAQSQRPLPAAAPLRFESWQASPPYATSKPTVAPVALAAPNRGRRALLGGAIGAAAGVVFCTAVSTLANDSAEGGLSFCPLDSYLLIGGAGFVLGAAIGWGI